MTKVNVKIHGPLLSEAEIVRSIRAELPPRSMIRVEILGDVSSLKQAFRSRRFIKFRKH